MNKTVFCPVKGDEITGDDCIIVCDVVDHLLKPTCLPEDVEAKEGFRQKCRQCKYHADLTD